MDFILHYDVAAFLLCIIVIALFLSRKHFFTKSNTFFCLMCVLLLESTVLDIFRVYTLQHLDEVPLWVDYVVNGVSFLSYNGIQLTFFRYILTITGVEDTKIGKVLKAVSYAALFYLSLLLATTPFTKLAFYFEDGVYQKGFLFLSLYFTAYSLIIVSIFVTLYSKKEITRYQKLTTVFMALGTSTAYLIQLFWENMLISNFVASVLLLILYHSLQSPREYLEEGMDVYNSKAFLEKTGYLLGRKKSFTVLAFELDGFQFVNQIMGMESGRRLLESVAKECQESHKGDLYYLGETKFAYIFEKNNSELPIYSDWIHWRFLSAFRVNGVRVNLTAKLCAVCCPEVEPEHEKLLTAINLSLQMCKKENYMEVYWPTKEEIVACQRSTLITHILKRAVRNKEFEVYFQPIYSAQDKRFSVAEALVRLKDPELGFIPPDEFIPIAERCGLILEIGDIVFKKVCEFMASKAVAKFGVRYIEVNLSMVQCMQENLHKHMVEIMDENAIPHCMIDFEITETYANGDNHVLLQNMEALIEKGCSFAVDDYGTGFSNTDYLIEFPFELVKLDKSFIWAADSNEKAKTVLSHTASMIDSLNLKIVAEGVETYEQAKYLLDMGCEFLQGYYFSPPIPPQKYLEFLRNSQQIIKEKLLDKAEANV